MSELLQNGYDGLNEPAVPVAEVMTAVDNAPNQLGPRVPFDVYRSTCDRYEGMMRSGICDADTYAQVADHPQTVLGLVDGQIMPVAANEALLNGSEAENSRPLRIIAPADLPGEIRDRATVSMRQLYLEDSEISELLNPAPGTRRNFKDVVKMLDEKTQGSLAESFGEPQFMVLSKYNTEACGHMAENQPGPVVTREGHLLTTDKEAILQRLPELIELHESVFARQASQIGYYDGLAPDMIEDILQDEHFIGAAAFDGETGKALMFAIFASGLEAAEQVPWINKDCVESLIRDSSDNAERPAVAMPMVITSKYSGLGVFAETVSLAMHEIIYRTQAKDKVYNLFSANLQSILYTPRIINSSILANGAKLEDCIVEASVLTTSN
ncbi:MAG TPA: hypothetical protein VFL85_00980 [Candidatus Saccharimonadales bacterium]|nr:hypothetical protein [Candidatus Saccharimonadales bacterium]